VINVLIQVETFVPESKTYNELLDFEKRLDSTILRKQMDIHEAAFKSIKSKRILRIFVSNTASYQPHMAEGSEPDASPSWTLKIEGRLLEVIFY
jgi:SWI/SNF-related matrix-associated actin-dependent regulator of chromatin subfamily D